jgi:hypothetical protein
MNPPIIAPIIANEPPNHFDPELVHRDLKVHRELWFSVTYMYHHIGDFENPDEQIRVTEYLLKVQPGKEDQLVQLATGWNPGILEWAATNLRTVLSIPIKTLSGRIPKILKVKWVE